MSERGLLSLPPFVRLGLLRAEANTEGLPTAFLNEVRAYLERERLAAVQILGPARAPIERIAGRYRSQLLISSATRGDLQRAVEPLREWLESSTAARKVRWSIDIDPVDLL